jgi:3-phytase
LFGLVVVTLGGSGAVRPASAAGTYSVTLRSTQSLPTTTVDQNQQSFAVRGLSGITYLGGTSYAAVMDNSNKIVLLNVELGADGSLVTSQFTGGRTLVESRDFEGIAYTGADRDSVYLSEEGTPGIHEYRLSDGVRLNSPAVPGVFQHIVANQGFESITINSDSASLWTANEQALTVDGPLATQQSGTMVRLLRYQADGNDYQPTAQFAYEVEPIHGAVFNGARSGLVDLVALPDGSLLSLERSAAFSDQGLFKNSIWSIDLDGATDISPLATGLSGQSYSPVSKTELWSGPVIGAGMNMEGLALGPSLGAGRWALIGIVDDGDPLSSNTLVSFELSVVPEPANLTQLLIPAFGIATAKRRKRRLA